VEALLKKIHARLAQDSKTPRMRENEIGNVLVDAAVKIHSALGLGLLESVYE
jgi:hypothetical protein